MQMNFQNTKIAFQSKSNQDLFRSYFIFKVLNNPLSVKMGASLAKAALSLHLPVRSAIRATVFHQFCGGETLEESLEKAKELALSGVGSILDVAVEGSQEEAVFENTTQEVLRTIDLAAQHPFLPFSVFKVTGIADFGLLEKIQSGRSLTVEEGAQWTATQARVLRICQAAYEKGVPLLIDAEESWIQDSIDVLATQMMEKFNRKTAIIYNTLQMYRKDRLAFLEKSHAAAVAGGYFLGVKIVRGAYLEKERKRAEELHLPSPLYETKTLTDQTYDRAIAFSVQHRENIFLCAGTHNEASTHTLLQLMEKEGISAKDPRIYFSQLYGMSDHLSYNLAQAGYLVAKYLPYGDVRILMPYLIRRAQENTSIHGQTPRELALLKHEISRRKIFGHLQEGSREKLTGEERKDE